jgi:DNA-binding transcriptional LysR family regulator
VAVNEADLRVFLTLADTENTRDAAAIQRVNQSNVSRALARLEAELGAELFTRHGRRLELNRVGAAFRTDASAAIEDFEAGRRRVRRLAGPQATIRLGFLQSVARRVVPRLIGTFGEVAPQVRFELRQGFARAMFELVAADELDVVFATPPGEAYGLEWQLMEEQQLCVALVPGHRLAGRESLSCADLDGEDFVAFAGPTELRRMIDPMLEQAGATVHITFESSEIDTIAGLVGAGLGVSILPVPRRLPSPELVLIPLAPASTRLLGLAWSAQRENPASVLSFLDHCVRLSLE